MKKTIWKFELKKTDIQKISMPEGAKILTVQLQHDIPYIWALVNPENKPKSRMIETFGTGHSIGSDVSIDPQYIGTYQLYKGDIIFHVFEYLGV